jgi:hypothetical protein
MPAKIMSVRRTERRIKCASEVRSLPQQIDPFGDDRHMADAPAWPELPAETRAALISLMTRLILDHADQNQTGSTTEAGHDL